MNLVLTSAATAFVGDSATRPTGAAGFISNATIARYSAAMGGVGVCGASAATALTVDASGVIDTRGPTAMAFDHQFRWTSR